MTLRNEDSKDKLYNAFKEYFEFAMLQFHEENTGKIRRLHIEKSYWIRTTAERIEDSKEFKNLAVQIPRPYKLKNFFRRSRLYLNMFENSAENVDGYFEVLWSALSEKSVKITTLRPVNGVDFFDNKVVFNSFIIQRFSKDQLDDLFETQINHTFYPYAEVDTKKLMDFWFIIKESHETRSNLKSKFLLNIDTSEFSKVSRTFPDRALQLLSLFEWEELEAPGSSLKDDLGWLGFSLPISFRITHDVLEQHYRSAELSALILEPDFDPKGKEIGERAWVGVHLLEKELERLKRSIDDSQSFLDSIDFKKCHWEFINRAMGYLGKAFFTDGFEQLLWHITVLEVLLTLKDEPITSNIRRRLGIILGKGDADEIKGIQKIFNELYDFRSELVHGGALLRKKSKPKEIYRGHLRRARELARRTLCWFIQILTLLHTELDENSTPLEKYPGQEELLFAIDFQLSSLKGEFGEVPLHLWQIEV